MKAYAMNTDKKSKSINDEIASTVQILKPQDFALPERKPLRPGAFSLLVRKLLQNWRQGTVSSKGRSEVKFSGKKPWKQKGTGRARAGTARSPLWKGGGTIFGPQPRTRTLKSTKKLRENVFNELVWKALMSKNVLMLDWQVPGDKPKTSEAFKLLKDAKLDKVKLNLFLPQGDVLHFASFINLPNVNVLAFDEINAYDLMLADKWIVLKKDFEEFKQRVCA